jgi:hypothetical protein
MVLEWNGIEWNGMGWDVVIDNEYKYNNNNVRDE